MGDKMELSCCYTYHCNIIRHWAERGFKEEGCFPVKSAGVGNIFFHTRTKDWDMAEGNNKFLKSMVIGPNNVWKTNSQGVSLSLMRDLLVTIERRNSLFLFLLEPRNNGKSLFHCHSLLRGFPFSLLSYLNPDCSINLLFLWRVKLIGIEWYQGLHR